MRWPVGLLLLAMLCAMARSHALAAPAPEAPPDAGAVEPPLGLEDATRALLGAPASDEALRGLPIRAITVELAGKRWARQDELPVPQLRAVAIGEAYQPELARRSIRELLATGGFASARADVEPLRDGVRMRLRVEPRRLVAAVRLEGDEIGTDQTMEAAAVAEGDEITEPALDAIAERVRARYAERGYADAQVDVDTIATDDPLRVLLRLTITPGEQRTVARRLFVIEPAYRELVAELRSSYDVDEGDALDEDELERADREMVEELQQAYFLRARVRHAVVWRGGQAFLFVYLESGPQFRFRFEGAESFDQQMLTDALGLEENPEAEPLELAERLRELYRVRGFRDTSVTVVEPPPETPAIRVVHFVIAEGDRIEVTRKIFPCLDPAAEELGLGAEDLAEEVDGILKRALPEVPLFTAVDPHAVAERLGPGTEGHRAEPLRPDPTTTFTPEAYERVVEHLRDLAHAQGFLNASVGPASLVRARCSRRSRAGQCNALPLPTEPLAGCRPGPNGLPEPEAPLGDEWHCEPDRAHGIHCASAATVSIPMHLGPRTTLYDIAFEGNRKWPAPELLALSELTLGSPLSNAELEAARVRLLGLYRDEGFAYAAVRTAIELSPDRTRARARFIVSEHDPVVIEGYEIRGAVRTDHELILGRLALCQELEECSESERYYRRDRVRKSEEQIATLGTFSSVTISLEDPDVPQTRKRVIITVAEQASQYLEPRVGFSTGEGFRMAFEYGHRNVGGQAIALTLRLELSILPDLLITEEDVAAKYSDFTLAERLERRNSLTVRFPEIGLGPLVSLTLDGVDVRDNQRDFGLSKEALLPTVHYQPVRTVNLQLGASVELNDVTVFGADTVSQAIERNPNLAEILRVPDGQTLALAQRVAAAWDRRDNAFSATNGTLLSLDVEHVHAFPTDDRATIDSEFLRFRGRVAGYVPLSDDGFVLALSVGAGYNLQLTSDSQTYPDRLFYLGGVDTIRGFPLDSVVPEDIAQQALAGKLPVDSVLVRGGDLYLNPRVELRTPLTETFGLGWFLDTGNVWTKDATFESPLDLLKLRYAVGAGIRIATPIGPIAFDLGIKLVRRQWEEFGATHFAIGLF